MIAKDSHNLQITLKDEQYKALLNIADELKGSTKKEPSKSQVIAYLIDVYEANKTEDNKNKVLYYSKAIKELKNYLNVTDKELANILNMPLGTLKAIKANGASRPPRIDNQKTINELLKTFNIKIEIEA